MSLALAHPAAESNSRPGFGLRTVLDGKFHLADGSIAARFRETPSTSVTAAGMGGAVGFSGENLSGEVVESSTFSTSSLNVILFLRTAALAADAAFDLNEVSFRVPSQRCLFSGWHGNSTAFFGSKLGPKIPFKKDTSFY